jgi:hypothetical protein
MHKRKWSGLMTRGGCHRYKALRARAGTLPVHHLTQAGRPRRAAAGRGRARGAARHPLLARSLRPLRPARHTRPASEKLGQLQPFLAVFSQICMGKLVSFGPPDTSLVPARAAGLRGGGDRARGRCGVLLPDRGGRGQGLPPPAGDERGAGGLARGLPRLLPRGPGPPGAVKGP